MVFLYLLNYYEDVDGMRKMIPVFALLLLFSLFPLMSINANEDSVGQKLSGEIEADESDDESEYVEIVKPDNAKDLKAARNTSTLLEEAYSYTNEEGEHVQVTTLKLSQADRGKEFDIITDPATNEYVVEESNGLVEVPELTSTRATREYFMGATYTTNDPARVALNRSRHELRWRGNSKDAWKVSRNASAWGAKPSKLGTNWHVKTNKYEGYVDRGKSIFSSSYHSYYNWDFGSKKKRTDVWHRMNLQGYNDGYTYVTVQKGKSGEGNSLLSFKLSTY